MSNDLFLPPLFIDIETVPMVDKWAQLPKRFQALWQAKSASFGATNEQEAANLFMERAGLHAEFGRVIVVGLGYITNEKSPEGAHIRTKVLASADERALLLELSSLLQEFPAHTPFCGHHIKSFDLPYLLRRLHIHRLPIPAMLAIQNKKPWEIPHIDTMMLWKFGDQRHTVSLDLLAAVFDIPSSKSTMSGKEVTHYFYEKNALDQIAAYCRADVVVTMQVYRALQGKPLLKETCAVS